VSVHSTDKVFFGTRPGPTPCDLFIDQNLLPSEQFKAGK